MSNSNLITIGFAKEALKPNSREWARFQSYAKELESYHSIVLTTKRDNLPERLESGNLVVYGTNTVTKIGALVKAVRLGRAIAKNSTDEFVVSSQDPFETGLAAWLISFARNCRLHVQLHGDFFGRYWVKEKLNNRLRQMFGLWLIKKADKIRVVSSRIAKSLQQRGVSKDRITVQPVSVSLQSFLAVGENRVYRGEGCNFIYLGRFAREKNLLALIEAFGLVSEESANSTLTLVGRGPEKKVIKEKLGELNLTNKVLIKAWVEDVPSELAKAEVFVLPSWHEGYALVLLEAIATGLPVVTTDVGCVGECVIHQENGLVAEPTAKALGQAMLEYTREYKLREVHGKAGHSKAKEISLMQSEYVKQWVMSFGLTPGYNSENG